MTEQEIRSLASSMSADDVVIYTQPDCAYCEMAKRWLDVHGFAYTDRDVTADPIGAGEFRRYCATGTPYVVIRRHANVRHLRDGFTSSAFLAALV